MFCRRFIYMKFRTIMWIITAAVAIVAMAAACGKEEPEKKPDGGNTPKDVLSAPELTVTANENSISFSWTAGTIENSKLDVAYTLYVGSQSGEFVAQ